MGDVIELPIKEAVKAATHDYVTTMADAYLLCCTIHGAEVFPEFNDYIEIPEDEDEPLILLKDSSEDIKKLMTTITWQMAKMTFKAYGLWLSSEELDGYSGGANDN